MTCGNETCEQIIPSHNAFWVKFMLSVRKIRKTEMNFISVHVLGDRLHKTEVSFLQWTPTTLRYTYKYLRNRQRAIGNCLYDCRGRIDLFDGSFPLSFTRRRPCKWSPLPPRLSCCWWWCESVLALCRFRSSKLRNIINTKLRYWTMS